MTSVAATQQPTTPSDQTDAPAPLTIYDAGQAHRLNLTFDPVLLYTDGKVPPNVHIIGVRPNNAGQLVILDGPESPGTAVPDVETTQMLKLLMHQAEQKHPGLGGILITTQRQVYAVSLAALKSAVVRQKVPDHDLSGIDLLAGGIPTAIRSVVFAASKLGEAEDPVKKTVGGILCPMAFALGVGALILLQKMSVIPVREFITQTPILANLAHPITIPWIDRAVSPADIGAWVPTLLQIIAIFFWRERVVKYAVIGVTAIDIIAGVLHWQSICMPHGVALWETYGGVVGAIGWVGYALITVLWSLGVAIGWEAVAILGLILAASLLGAMFWTGEKSLEKCSRGFVRIVFALPSLLYSIDNEWKRQQWNLQHNLVQNGQPQLQILPTMGILFGVLFVITVIVLGVIVL